MLVMEGAHACARERKGGTRVAGMPYRRAKARAQLEAETLGTSLVPADQMLRVVPADWSIQSEARRLQSMWGHSLTVGMEVLCWGPLRGLSPAELNMVDRVRHDTMLVCLRLGLASVRAPEGSTDQRELIDAIERFGSHDGQRYDLAK